jgi:hypothetical protein
MTIKRVVVWFSAGVTSAVAAKITADKYRNSDIPVLLVNTDTGSEDEDNYRFMADVAEWVGLPLTVIRSNKYNNTFEVYDGVGFLRNQYGARCTTELKKRPREMFQQSGDLQVFGFHAGEVSRAQRFTENNPEILPWFPLVEMGIGKTGARGMLLQAGIAEPRTYAEGFNNANCLAAGCVKGGIGYWNHIRKVRPLVFQRMAEKERQIGFALLKVMKDGVYTPVFLDELDPSLGNHRAEPDIQCGLFCGQI